MGNTPFQEIERKECLLQVPKFGVILPITNETPINVTKIHPKDQISTEKE